MASKKDKEKIDSNSLVLKPKSVIATSPTVSFMALTNKFLAFNPRSPISYPSTLASPYDPFVISSQKSRLPFIKYDKPSTYVIVPYYQHLFSIEFLNILSYDVCYSLLPSPTSLQIFIGFLNILQRTLSIILIF
jgi:hypothetical protein